MYKQKLARFCADWLSSLGLNQEGHVQFLFQPQGGSIACSTGCRPGFEPSSCPTVQMSSAWQLSRRKGPRWKEPASCSRSFFGFQSCCSQLVEQRACQVSRRPDPEALKFRPFDCRSGCGLGHLQLNRVNEKCRCTTSECLGLLLRVGFCWTWLQD